MFLHAGASMHGHEFSNRRPSPNPLANNRRSPLLRAAFQPSNPRASLQVEAQRQQSHQHPEPRVRQRPVSEVLPRGYSEPVVRFQEPEVDQPLPEPSMSEDESAQSASDASYLSDTTANTRRKKKRTRAPRRSTNYLFAHPAPNFRSKKQILRHIRPSLLLQLQQLSLDKRPRPTVDVFPSTLIAGNVVAPRFWKKCPRLFGVKGELGVHDIILVRSEEYDSGLDDTDSDQEEESLEQRELIAVLSPVKREDRAEIVFADGSVWVAIPLPSGSYDFVHTDENGLVTTVRWARRTAKQFKSTPSWDSTTSAVPPAKASDSNETRFTFSVIDPQSRRHPIMATLLPNKLEILDQYTTVSQSSARYPPSRPMGRSLTTPVGITSPSASPTALNNTSQLEELRTALKNPLSPINQRATHPISEQMKSLISVTAIWVALKQGWAPRYKYPSPNVEAANNGVPSATGTPNRSSLTVPKHPGAKREDSFSAESRRSSSHDDHSNISDPVQGQVAGGQSLTFKRGRTRPVSLSINPCARSRDTSPTPSTTSPSKRVPPRRTTSTGAAFMQRRVQSRVSESSDVERATRGLKGRSRKVTSGDFGTRMREGQGQLGVPTTLHKNSSGSFISEEAAIAPLALPSSPPERTDSADPSPYPGHHRNYTMHIHPDHTPTELRDVNGTPSSNQNAEALVNDEKGAKWRKFSNWFKRLGH